MFLRKLMQQYLFQLLRFRVQGLGCWLGFTSGRTLKDTQSADLTHLGPFLWLVTSQHACRRPPLGSTQQCAPVIVHVLHVMQLLREVVRRTLQKLASVYSSDQSKFLMLLILC